MSDSIENYIEIIEQLKPVVNEPDFNQVLSQVAATVPKPKRFLLKMELRRLAKPCSEPIDLRGSVDGECIPFDHEKLTHYLDEIAIEVFERQVRAFGHYSQGVFEAVHNTENSFKAINKREEEEKAKQESAAKTKGDDPSEKEVEPEVEVVRDYTAPVINFSGPTQRGEERMNFSIAVEVFTSMNQSIGATTLDLSVSGVRIKTELKHMFTPEEQVTIQFRGLEGESAQSRKEGIAYEVTMIDRGKDEQRISLKRNFEKSTPAFDSFLARFIHGNKRKYKVNMDNTITAILAKGYEQYYIPYFTSIPVFIEQHGENYSPKFVLTNDNNKESIYFWADEENKLRLGYLFSDKRIKQCLEMPEKERELYIYAFNQVKNGKSYFYSASHLELDAVPQLRPTFLGYGSRKASWRVYKLQLCEVEPNQCHLPLSLPDSVGENIRKKNQPPPPRLMARLQHLKLAGLLTDITNEWNTRSYQAHKISKALLPKIKHFSHPKNRPPPNLSLFRFKYQNLRAETRFQLRTKAIIKLKGLKFEGVTEDISVKGVKIELNSPFKGDKHAIVHLAFPQLQEMTKKYRLEELAYEVRNISKDGIVVNLLVVEEAEEAVALSHQNISQKFFNELIKNNRNTLKYQLDEEEIPGIGEALRNIYSANVLNMAFFLRKDGLQIMPEAVAKPSRPHPLLSLLGHKTKREFLNLFTLYPPSGANKNFLEGIAKKLAANSKPVVKEIFVALSPNQTDIKDAIDTVLCEEFADDKHRQQFIKKSMGAGRFFAIKVLLGRTGRPDTDLLHAELSYIGAFAMHKAKKLEEKLWQVNYMGDLIDVTTEVMLRYGFNQQHISANQGKKQSA